MLRAFNLRGNDQVMAEKRNATPATAYVPCNVTLVFKLVHSLDTGGAPDPDGWNLTGFRDGR